MDHGYVEVVKNLKEEIIASRPLRTRTDIYNRYQELKKGNGKLIQDVRSLTEYA